MALSNRELQQKFRQRRRQEATSGLQRVTLILPTDTVSKIESLAGFFELSPEKIVERAINPLWNNRYNALIQKVETAKEVEPQAEVEIVEEVEPQAMKPKPRHYRDKLPTVNRDIRTDQKHNDESIA